MESPLETLSRALDTLDKLKLVTPAEWPASGHRTPVAVRAGDQRILINGRPPRLPVRVLAEDEYQLLLAGFLAAGGKVER